MLLWVTDDAAAADDDAERAEGAKKKRNLNDGHSDVSLPADDEMEEPAAVSLRTTIRRVTSMHDSSGDELYRTLQDNLPVVPTPAMHRATDGRTLSPFFLLSLSKVFGSTSTQHDRLEGKV